MRKHPLYAAVAATLGISTAVHGAADPTLKDLQEQIEALKAKITELEQKEEQHVTQADVDATIHSVMQDAEKRSQLFQMEGFTAGWSDGKFLLQSSDGNFLLHPFAWIQVRNTTSWREDGKQPNDTDDTQNGFEIRRLKFGIDGNAFSKDLTYKFQFQANRKDGTPFLDDAWVKYKFCDQFSIRGGQFLDPLAHESQVSSRRFMAAERSFTNDYFSLADDYVQGVSLIYDAKGPLRGEAAFTDGGNFMTFQGNRVGNNQNFQDFSTNNADFGFAGRVEYLVMGDWKNYEDYTAMGTKDALLVLGAGADWTESGDTDFFTHTVDLQYEMSNGLAFYAAYYGRYTKDSPAGVNDEAVNHQDLYDWGALAQVSCLINPKLEIFARYGYTGFDDDGVPAGVNDKVQEITVGGNYYLHGHNAKLTVDLGWLPDGCPVNDDGAGILASQDTSFYLRCQFQLAL